MSNLNADDRDTNPTGLVRDNNPRANARDTNPTAQIGYAVITPSVARFRITENVIIRITEDGSIRLVD
jgi:hypothetical protein